MSPKVSVIVPVYNVAPYLGQCLDTILLQTLSNIEVICVDDGSTDGSLDILKTYTMFDDRLKVIQQENAGAAAARNRGLKEATGEFISVLDSDDFFRPEMLEKMVQKAEEENSDVVVCGYTTFDNKTQTETGEQKVEEKYLVQSPLSRNDFHEDLFTFMCGGAAWNKLIRHDLIKKYKINFDERVRYCDDLMFSCCVLGSATKISVLPDTFIHYRINTKTQQSASKPDTIMADHCLTLSLAYEKLKKLDLPYDLMQVFSKKLPHSFDWSLTNLDNDKKRMALTSIRSHLNPDLYQALFGTKGPVLSLIVCAYNAGEFLNECLDSCLNQTLKEIEIICVDDGSSDNTLAIMESYARQDHRFKVIHQENQGLPVARQNAMKIAKGQYIQFLDADDYLDLDTTECLFLYAQIYHLDMLSFAAIEFKNDSRIEFEDPYHILRWLPEKFMPVFTYSDIGNVLTRVAVTSALTLYRRAYLSENDIHWVNKKVAYEDTPFFIESLLKGARMGALPLRFYHRRVHEAAITQNMKTNFPDYCWICQYTLRKIYEIQGYGDIFIHYLYGFMNKIYMNYEKLDSDIQQKMLPVLFRFNLHILKKYRLPLTGGMEKLSENYLRNKKITQKIPFSFLNLMTIWRQSGYTINPFRLSFSPFVLSVFGKTVFFKKTHPLPKIHPKRLPEKECFILCFDNLHDGLTECIDAYTFFQYLQEKGIPSKYVVHPQNPLALKMRHNPDIILSDNKNFFVRCAPILAQSRYVLTSFGLYQANRSLKKLPWLKYILIDHGVEYLKKAFYSEKDFDYRLTGFIPSHSHFQKKGLWKGKQINVGLPRWSHLKKIPHSEKQIFVFFTWRKSNESLFQKRIFSFLTCEKLQSLLKENNITLNVGIHHESLVKNNLMDFKGFDNIHVVQGAYFPYIGKTDLMITDYSSLAFDFMFLDIPVLFYRPDKDIPYTDTRDRRDMKCAQSRDKELYNVFYEENAVINKIAFYIQNHFVLEPEYKKINDSFFWEKKDICKHLYEQIKAL